MNDWMVATNGDSEGRKRRRSGDGGEERWGVSQSSVISSRLGGAREQAESREAEKEAE